MHTTCRHLQIVTLAKYHEQSIACVNYYLGLKVISFHFGTTNSFSYRNSFLHFRLQNAIIINNATPSKRFLQLKTLIKLINFFYFCTPFSILTILYILILIVQKFQNIINSLLRSWNRVETILVLFLSLNNWSDIIQWTHCCMNGGRVQSFFLRNYYFSKTKIEFLYRWRKNKIETVSFIILTHKKMRNVTRAYNFRESFYIGQMPGGGRCRQPTTAFLCILSVPTISISFVSPMWLFFPSLVNFINHV